MSPAGGLFGGRRGRLSGAGGAARNEELADKASPLFWRGLKTGDFVSVADREAFAASLAAGPSGSAGSGGAIDYRVGDVRRFALRGREGGRAVARDAGRSVARDAGRSVARDAGRSAARGAGLDPGAPGTYTFAELVQEGSGLLYLGLVELPELFELRLCFIPPELEPGTRDDWIDRGDTWLFLPPADPEDFLSSELEYAPYPDVPPVDGRKLLYSRLGPGALYAEALDTGAPTIIAEYECEAGESGQGAPEDPLLIAVEEGWMRSDGTEPEEGGCLTVMLGRRIRPDELEHWPA